MPKGHALLRQLRDLGFILTKDPKAPYFLAIDHNQKDYKRFVSYGGTATRAVLLRLEPDVIYPKQYTKSVENLYSLVLTPGGIGKEPNNSNQILGWGYRIDSNPLEPRPFANDFGQAVHDLPSEPDEIISDWVNRSMNYSLIASNKVSPLRSSNYSLRRTIARSMKPQDLSVFGQYWEFFSFRKIHHRIGVFKFSLRNGYWPNLGSVFGSVFSTCTSHKGEVEDKYFVLKNSKFNLVIENSNSCVTEKIFDCLVAGAIPIYFGPRLHEIGIDPDLAFQFIDELEFLNTLPLEISHEQIVRLRKAGKEFLQSSNYQANWSEGGVYSQILAKVLNVYC
jgi:hypothetical protein